VEICVRLGDEVTAAMWSCSVVDATGSGFGGGGAGAGAVTGAGGAICVGADDDDAEALLCWLAEGVTAAAAAVAYFNGGLGCAAGRPALSILDMGCCAKFGFGGGFGAGCRRIISKICKGAERGEKGQTFACC
jgi:hypothetical protein